MLREVLKQDRLPPQPAEFQMAWLRAFNEGLLATSAAGDIQAAPARLAQGEAVSGLGLEDSRELWKQAATNWLRQGVA